MVSEEKFERWGYYGYVPPEVLHDAPVLDRTMGMFAAEARAKADTDGYTLSEAYDATQHDTVWVEDWSDDEEGPSIVSVDLARMAGLDVDTLRPGPTMIRMSWEITARPDA